MLRKLILALGGLGLAMLTGSANAATVAVSGLTFSEVSSDVELISVSGTGYSWDPIVLTEEVSGLDVTISIRGIASIGSRAGTFHSNSFFLKKIVKNLTGQSWEAYDHELQSTLGTASTDGDGLSFAQDAASVRPFTSSVFASVDEVTDVRDYVNFYNGSVPVGGSVTFNYVVTDGTSHDIVYLRQRPDFATVTPEPEVPTPTAAAAGLALIALLGASRITRRH